MKARWLIALALVLAVSANTVLEASARPPAQPLSTAPGTTRGAHGLPGADLAVSMALLPPLQGLTAIALGYGHTCALTASGGVKCWGANAHGQLGDGTTTSRSTPVDVVGLASGVTAITAGFDHTCALTAGGGIKCWGYNQWGQLGDGTADNHRTPVNVVGLESGVIAISGGQLHTCALLATGGVKCWGYNVSGQLGDGTTAWSRPTPVDVVGLAGGVAAIAAAGGHTCALTAGGGIQCWGYNHDGALGDGTTTNRSRPVDVLGLASGVAAIAAGGGHTCALTTGGGVRCWGANWVGQLGDGTTTNHSTAVDVAGLAGGVTAIAAGWEHTCALLAGGGAGTLTAPFRGASRHQSGQVQCWGRNKRGELGDGTTDNHSTPVDVLELTSGITQIAAGEGHTCALTAGGTVQCWGSNWDGQLGDATRTWHGMPVEVIDLAGTVAAIATGWEHTCAVTADGMQCWGHNEWGELGDGTTIQRSTPVGVAGLPGGTAAVAGKSHTCALTADGAVRCWGYNSCGQLGDGTTTWRTTPVDVLGLAGGVAAIAAGEGHTCALTTGGGVQCWGSNSQGVLGDGTTTQRGAPVDVLGLTNGVTAIAAGWYHNCAVAAGGVKCWGDNAEGQLGDGTTTWRNAPVDVPGLGSGVATLAAGKGHTCALTTGGTVQCWGANGEGQLGDGSTSPHRMAVQVPGLSGVTALAAGKSHTCALTVGGKVKCWGLNEYGQLGDGTTAPRSRPVDVVSLAGAVTALAAGENHTCALLADGRIQCWGTDRQGQLGLGTLYYRTTPVRVVDLLRVYLPLMRRNKTSQVLDL